MNCPYCGQYNEDGARFCGNCGADLSAAQPAAPVQPDYSQQSYQEPTYAQQPYDTGYQQPQADPYAQQPYQQPQADPYAQQQYPQGYNAPVQQPKKKFPVIPVVIGVVALVAVVGGFLLFRGNGNGGGNEGGPANPGGGTPTITGGGGNEGGGTNPGGGNDTGGSSSVLTDTYTDSSYGYSFRMPDGGTIQTGDDPGQVYTRFTKPCDLWINAYVSAGTSATIDSQTNHIVEKFNATIVEQGSDYGITVCTDSAGDTNYTYFVLRNGNMYFLDIYYHPADDGTMRPIAAEIMNSFTV